MATFSFIPTLTHDVVNEFAVDKFGVIQSPVFNPIPWEVEIFAMTIFLVVVQQTFLVVRCLDLSSFLTVVMAYDGHVVVR